MNAPTFFTTHHTDTTNMDEGIRPITYEEFREKAPSQMHLFYSQGRARHGVYKESKVRFYSRHIPRKQYRKHKCQLCLFYGHIQWSCPDYVCPWCKQNCGHRRENCTAPQRNFDMVVMMANTPELTPEPQDFPPVALTSLLELTSNESEGAPPTADLATNLTVAETIIYRSIGIFEQFIQDYDQQVPPTLDRSLSPATPTQSEFDLDEKNYKLVLALEHMQYVQERMLSTDPIYLCRHILMIQQMKRFHSMTRIDMLPAVHLARMMRTSSMIPLTTQLFNLWETCLTINLMDRPSNILSYQIHQQYSTHSIFQLFIESSLTVNVPRELLEVPQENFIVQPSWLFHRCYQLMLKHMFLYMKYLFCFIFSLSR